MKGVSTAVVFFFASRLQVVLVSFVMLAICLILSFHCDTQTHTYRIFMYKSRGVCAKFQVFGAASIQVWALFEGGLYAMP